VVIIDWREVSIDADKAAVDAVSDILVDCGAGGVAIEDPQAVRATIAAKIWDAFEFPDEFLQREFIRIKAYFPCDHTLEERLQRLKTMLDGLNTAYLPGSIKNVNLSDIREEDWANSWKAYYKPVQAGERVVIKPTWEQYDAGQGDLVIELDPGMAFGTGTHPTTVMCIRMLEKVVKGGETVFDVGTGSGILAVAAAKLGAGRVRAVDMDEVAVNAARFNVAVNHVEDKVEVAAGNLLDGIVGRADIVVANIVADIIIRLCPDAFGALKAGGKFIASGIIAPRAEEVIDHIKKMGFIVCAAAREGDWVALLAVREE